MTPTRCRAGQCARIIQSIDPVNLGRMVYVVERIYPDANDEMIVGDVVYDAQGFRGVIWVIEAIGGPLLVGPPAGYRHLAPAKDTSLEPLPDPDPETETTDKELTV